MFPNFLIQIEKKDSEFVNDFDYIKLRLISVKLSIPAVGFSHFDSALFLGISLRHIRVPEYHIHLVN